MAHRLMCAIWMACCLAFASVVTIYHLRNHIQYSFKSLIETMQSKHQLRNHLKLQCVRDWTQRINHTNELYMNQITERPPLPLNQIKFYFLDWKNTTDPLWYGRIMKTKQIGKITKCVALYDEERFFLFSTHVNRVYDINSANIIIFGFPTSREEKNYPCFSRTGNPRLYFRGRTEFDIVDHSQCPRNHAHDWIIFNDWLYTTITNIVNHHPHLPIFMYDHAYDAYQEALVNLGTINVNHVIIGKFGFISSDNFSTTYRTNTDIQVPPPILHWFYNEAVNASADMCRKRKYFYSFAGNLNRCDVRRHFKQLWDKDRAKHRDKRIKIMNMHTGFGSSNESNDTYDMAYKELMLESSYLLIFRGDKEWSYRFREALLTFNILMLIGMDHYIMPYENVINYTEWYARNGIIRVDIDAFNSVSTMAQFEEQFIPKLTDEELCAAYSYNKKMVDLYFKDTISEVNALLFSLQQRINAEQLINTSHVIRRM